VHCPTFLGASRQVFPEWPAIPLVGIEAREVGGRFDLPLGVCLAKTYETNDEVALLSLLNKSQRNGPRAGILINEQNVAIAVVRRRAGQKPLIEHCAVYACENNEPAEQLLRRHIAKLGLARASVHAVTSADDYQLVQVESPEVQPAELRAAIRWRLRDVINFHIDDAVVDVFEIPDQSRRSKNKMLFAVAARSAAVQRLVAAIAPVARDFDVIDIPELCLRNVSALLPQDQKGVATLLLGEKFAQLILTRQGVLYLARRIEYSRSYDFDGDATGGAKNIDAAALALELQRSLDYFESNYDQTPIGDLVLAPAGANSTRLLSSLQSETSLRISVLELSEIMEGADALGQDLHPDCLLALGAALRVETTSL
jgi:MSHA biogenesis protein MshI